MESTYIDLSIHDGSVQVFVSVLIDLFVNIAGMRIYIHCIPVNNRLLASYDKIISHINTIIDGF